MANRLAKRLSDIPTGVRIIHGHRVKETFTAAERERYDAYYAKACADGTLFYHIPGPCQARCSDGITRDKVTGKWQVCRACEGGWL